MNPRPYPVLYSLRQCPYCIRARLALLLANQPVLIREIVTKNKPQEMLAISSKGTVPILLLNDGTVIDESLDIMIWALRQNDHQHLLMKNKLGAEDEMISLIHQTDREFVRALNAYRAASRYHDDSEIDKKALCERFISGLEHRLTIQRYLMGNALSLADYAILPFIRQFSRVDRKWFNNAPYPNLRHWLSSHYCDPLYAKAMKKFPKWLENRETMILEP